MAAQNGTNWKQNVNKMEQNGNKMERQRLNSLGIRSEVVRLWGMAQKHKRGISALAVIVHFHPSIILPLRSLASSSSTHPSPLSSELSLF